MNINTSPLITELDTPVEGNIRMNSDRLALYDGEQWIEPQSLSPYEMAFNEFDNQLKSTGKPSLKVIMDSFKETHPEYFL